jgi:PEP-CTERM motif-containing protein
MWNKKLVTVAIAFTALLVTAEAARASIVFDFSPPFPPNPDQHVKFDDPSLIVSGMTVQGSIDLPSVVFNMSGLESLAVSGGQSVVSSTDDGFTWLLFQPALANVGFDAFEANLEVFKPRGGGAVTGNVLVFVTDTNGVTQSQSHVVSSNGSNFFNLLATDSQRIRSVLIESDADLSDIRQIRVGGVTENIQPTQVPEPATLMLVGSGLVVVARRLRRNS